MNAELTGVDNVEEVLRELEKSIESAQQSSKNNHKVSKVLLCTTTVKLWLFDRIFIKWKRRSLDKLVQRYNIRPWK